MYNLLVFTNSTTATKISVHGELETENNEKKGLSSSERDRERNMKNEGLKTLVKNSYRHHRNSDCSDRNSDSIFAGTINGKKLFWESKFKILGKKENKRENGKVRRMVIGKICDVFSATKYLSCTCLYIHKRQNQNIQQENLPRSLTHDPHLTSPSQTLLNFPSYETHKPKIRVFDPNLKINQLILQKIN